MAHAAFIPYAGFTTDIKKTYSHEYLAAQHALGVQVKHYKQWDKNDLVALYDSYFGKEIFHHLARLIAQARHDDMLQQKGDLTHSFAQDDLNSIAPNGLDWHGYEALMKEALMEIKRISLRLTKDLASLLEDSNDADSYADHVAPHPAFGMRGIGSGMEAFDHQAALARLDAFKDAAPKSTVREAVASLKQAFTRSAS